MKFTFSNTADRSEYFCHSHYKEVYNGRNVVSVELKPCGQMKEEYF